MNAEMMTTTEALNKIAFDEGYLHFGVMMNSMNGILLLTYIEKAMQLYAQQFIDVADEIIFPALDILPPTYQEDIDRWYETIYINAPKQELK